MNHFGRRSGLLLWFSRIRLGLIGLDFRRFGELQQKLDFFVEVRLRHLFDVRDEIVLDPLRDKTVRRDQHDFVFVIQRGIDLQRFDPGIKLLCVEFSSEVI